MTTKMKRVPVKFARVRWSMLMRDVTFDDGTEECIHVDDMPKEMVKAMQAQIAADKADREAHDCRNQDLGAQFRRDAETPNLIVRDANKHDEKKHLTIYGLDASKQGNNDLKNKVAEKEWPRYIEGQGPMPFQTTVERKEYLGRYGFTED